MRVRVRVRARIRVRARGRGRVRLGSGLGIGLRLGVGYLAALERERRALDLVLTHDAKDGYFVGARDLDLLAWLGLRLGLGFRV